MTYESYFSDPEYPIYLIIPSVVLKQIKGKRKNKQIKGNIGKQIGCFSCAVLPYTLATTNPPALYDISLQVKIVVNLGTEDYVPRSLLWQQNKQLSSQGCCVALVFIA